MPARSEGHSSVITRKASAESCCFAEAINAKGLNPMFKHRMDFISPDLEGLLSLMGYFWLCAAWSRDAKHCGAVRNDLFNLLSRFLKRSNVGKAKEEKDVGFGYVHKLFISHS